MAARMLSNAKVMIFGGGGLVGQAIARRLALLPIRPAQIILASGTRERAVDAVQALRKEQDERAQYIPRLRNQPKLEIIPEWGNIYVRHSLAQVPRFELEQHPLRREELLDDIYGDLDAAYEQSHLVHLLRKHRPSILVDAINTATGLSYKNTFHAASKVQQALDARTGGNAGNFLADSAQDLLLAQSVPNLVRHVSILSKAAHEIDDVEQYIKIGTTGTGGMGLNLPFSHSESQPSHLILAKNEAAFGHTGLLFLWSRTPGAPAVREIKPAAGIGYKDITIHPIRDRYGNTTLLQPRLEAAVAEGDMHTLNVREPMKSFTPLLPMQTVTVDCGENGRFSADEFKALSAPGSMELISPEEVAEVAVQEMLGVPTGHNVLAAMASSVLPPGYRAGSMRPAAVHYLDEMLEKVSQDAEQSTSGTMKATVPSIATGTLGPQLAKYLFEAHLLKLYFDGDDELSKLAFCDPVLVSTKLCEDLRKSLNHTPPAQLANGKPSVDLLSRLAPTIGVPILLEDYSLVRGPNITDPEPKGSEANFTVSREQMCQYARRGWVDLRPENIQLWRARAQHILSEPPVSPTDTTSLTGLHYTASTKKIDPSALTSWILAGELHGQRDWDMVTELTDNETIASY